MKTWQLSNGTKLWQVLSGRSNSFLISTAGGISILVDTGLSSARGRLLRNMRNTGIVKLDYLLLTHTHFDHCRNASFLKDKYGCKILVHHSEAPFTTKGYTTIPGGTNPFTRLISPLGKAIGKRWFGYQPFVPDILLDQSTSNLFDAHDLKIVETPGHCSGSVSLFLRNEIAIVGDGLFGVFPDKVLSPFADDKRELIKSWKRMLDSGCSLFLSGHGKPISRQLLKDEYLKYASKFRIYSSESTD